VIGTNGHHSSDSESQGLVEGTVEAVNARGIKIRGEWFNVSQFKPLPLPEVGEYVRLKLQAKGFIDNVEVVKGAHDPETPTVLSARDDRIARLAVLKAAAQFCGLWGQSREEIKSDHVLLLADKWLKWVEGE
jgi:hypothetical protein